jgi:hypothetical protein
MLYTANHEKGGRDRILSDAPICASTGTRGYKSHAKNHPCTLWVRESLAHYNWLLDLALELVREHMFRFAPKVIHACNEHLLWLQENPPPGLLTVRTWLRDPPTAMPDEFRIGDSIRSYIAYYNGSKRERGLLDRRAFQTGTKSKREWESIIPKTINYLPSSMLYEQIIR